MKKLEKILALLIFISLILKFNLIAGGSMLLVCSLTVLSLIYYPLGFAFFNGIRLREIFKKSSYTGISTWRILGAIGAGMAFSALCMGILFKLQFWTGANMNLLAGLVTIPIILVIVLIKYSKSKSEYYIRIIKRIAIIGGIGLILLLTPGRSIRKFEYRNHPDYINAYENYMENPGDKELEEKMLFEYTHIKKEMKLIQQGPNE